MKKFLASTGLVVVSILQIVKIPVLILVEIVAMWVAWVSTFGGSLLDFTEGYWYQTSGGNWGFSIIILIFAALAKWVLDILFAIASLPFVLLANIPMSEVKSGERITAEPRTPSFIKTEAYIDDIWEVEQQKEQLLSPVQSECPNCYEINTVSATPWECNKCGSFVASS